MPASSPSISDRCVGRLRTASSSRRAPRPSGRRSTSCATWRTSGRCVGIPRSTAISSVSTKRAKSWPGRIISSRLAIAELAFIGGTKGLNTTEERYAGFWGALVAAGLSVDAAPAGFVPARPAFGEEATKRLLRRKSRPTAPVLASSQLTVGAFEAIGKSSLALPRDVSLPSGGDAPWFCFWKPGIAAVALPSQDVATTCGLAPLSPDARRQYRGGGFSSPRPRRSRQVARRPRRHGRAWSGRMSLASPARDARRCRALK
jgi:hypothetical protein